MKISLKAVDTSCLSDYILLEKSEGLPYWMSTTRPRTAGEQAPSTLFWKYICLDDDRIGAIWIEKGNATDSTASLGIFISHDENLGKGIGTTAIRIAVAQAQKEMRFTKVELNVRDTNVRAIACYEKCGFKETGRFMKNYLDEEVEVIIMERTETPDCHTFFAAESP